MEERLQKLIAHAGVASRRKAEELIEGGQVTVNGRVASLGDKADPETDDIRVQGRRLQQGERHRYIVLNKRRGIVSTTNDPEGRPTVLDALENRYKERLYPVGRLDIDSDGLVLLTNDGDLANKLTHPRFGCEKTYKVLVEGQPTEPKLEQWRNGVVIEDDAGRREKTGPCKIRVIAGDRDGTWLRVVMGEGKNRQIRRVGEALGHPVKRLTRTHIGSIELGHLKAGTFRELSSAEVQALKACSKPARRDTRPRPKRKV